MADTRDLLVRIKGDTNDFERSMGGVKSSSGEAHTSFLKMTGAVAAGQAIFSAATAVIGKTVDFMKDSVQQYQEAEAASKELQHAVIDVTGATQAQLKATNALADSLSRKGVLDDDVIRKGLAQLSTFGLTNDSVQKLGKSMADLTVNQFGVKASGDQAVQSANIMAKALNGNFGALEKMGIHLTDTQRNLIKFGDEAERVDTINQVLAANLRTNQATALETTEGKLAHLNVMWGNMKESIGQALVNAITPMATGLSNFVSSDRFQQWVQNTGTFINAYIKPAFQWIISTALPTLAEWGRQAIQLGEKVFNFLKPSLDALFNTLKNDLMPALEKLWKQVIEPLAPVIGVILVGAIWLLINGLNVAIQVISVTISVLSSVLNWFGRVAVAIWNFFSAIPGAISSAFSGLYGIITDPFKAAFNGIAWLWNNTVGKLHWKAPDWVPGIGGKEVGAPKIPMLAQGGIVDRATLAMIGEGSEPEAVMPLSKIPKMVQQINEQNGGGGSSSPVNITLNFNVGMYAGMPIEKRQIALELWKETVRAARAQGVQLPMIGAMGVQ